MDNVTPEPVKTETGYSVTMPSLPDNTNKLYYRWVETYEDPENPGVFIEKHRKADDVVTLAANTTFAITSFPYGDIDFDGYADSFDANIQYLLEGGSYESIKSILKITDDTDCKIFWDENDDSVAAEIGDIDFDGYVDSFDAAISYLLESGSYESIKEILDITDDSDPKIFWEE